MAPASNKKTQFTSIKVAAVLISILGLVLIAKDYFRLRNESITTYIAGGEIAQATSSKFNQNGGLVVVHKVCSSDSKCLELHVVGMTPSNSNAVLRELRSGVFMKNLNARVFMHPPNGGACEVIAIKPGTGDKKSMEHC
nr:hypothetical protein [uncultured Roseateles sp.]